MTALSTRLADRKRMRLGTSLLAAALALLASAGCAPKQIILLDLEPRPMAIYVDGERVPEGSPESLELRADRPHVLFFKKEGYRAQQVVLRAAERDGQHRLSPDRVAIRLKPLTPKGRDLKVELDE